MQIIDLGDRLQLEFVAANRPDVPGNTIVLTKYPVQLVNAITCVLNAERDLVVEFTGVHYRGRACVFRKDAPIAFALVFEFSTPAPIGYLIHTGEEQMREFKNKVGILPASPHSTD